MVKAESLGKLSACSRLNGKLSNEHTILYNNYFAANVTNTIELKDNFQNYKLLLFVCNNGIAQMYAPTVYPASYIKKIYDSTKNTQYFGTYPSITTFIGSTTADIGNSSRSLKDEEKAAGVAENIVAIDGIAVCVDPANEVAGLTKEQLTNIYNGTVTNWKEVGGADEPIIVIGREAGSGTRGAFEELVDLKDACKYANELDSTGAVIAKVASTPGAIGYASLDALDDSVKALSLEGVEATAENIKAGNYFLSRPFVMATKGEISEQNDLVQAWFDYVMGDEGQQIASEVGLITVK